MTYTIVDLETVPQSRALAIPSDADERAGRRVPWEKTCSTNPRLGRIVALGVKTGTATIVHCAATEDDEAALVQIGLDYIAASSPLVTFAGQSFDLPFLHVRAAVLGVTIPYHVSAYLKRYVTHPHADLLSILMNWDRPEKGDTLHGWCDAFGIPVDDTTTGADIGTMHAAGDLDGIRAHCVSDLFLTDALAFRMAAANLLRLD